MNQGTDNKTTNSKKVTILSDIVLNPLRSPLRRILPFPSVTSIAPLENNKPLKEFDHPTISNIKNQGTLKRKRETGLLTIVPAVAEPKKPRTKENDEETVFNYMTGTYEKVINQESSGGLEYIQEFTDTKEEIKIEENSLLNENITLLDIKDERQSLEKVQCEDQSKTNFTTTPTIDLTDDDTGPTSNVNKNFFIQNVLALHNTIELQALANEKANVKFSLQNVDLPNTVQEKVIAKKTITQKSPSIEKLITSKTIGLAKKDPVSFISPNLFVISGSVGGVQNIKQNKNNQKSKQSSNISRIIIQEKIPTIITQIKAPTVPKVVTAKIFWPGREPITPIEVVEEISESLQNLQRKGTQNFIPFPTQTITQSNDPPQNSTINILSLNCHTCTYKGQSKRDLIFHIYDIHLKHNFELMLICKLCNFETKLLSVMEKHDLGHGNSDQERVKGVNLSTYVEIKVRKKEQVVTSTSEIDNLKNDSSVETIELSDSDEEAPQNNPKEMGRYQCFDCSYVTSMLKLLENHAVKHSESKFECPRHTEISPNCLECQYKKCLLGLGTNRFQCGKCGYRTRKLSCFTIHTDEKFGGCAKDYLLSSDSESEHDNSLDLKCFHCSFDPITMDALINHAKMHSEGAFTCDIHLSQLHSKCNKCIYEAILNDLTKSSCDGEENAVSSNKNTTPSSTSSTETLNVVGYKCFHCSFVGDTRSWLKSHAVKHFKQNFQCDIHLNVDSETCEKCLYKHVLFEVNREEETLRQHSIDKHKNNTVNGENNSIQGEFLLRTGGIINCNDNEHNTNNTNHNEDVSKLQKNGDKNSVDQNCQELAPKENKMLQCLDCNNFKTRNRDELKQHSAKHYNIHFNCDKHLSAEGVTDCEKCFYFCIKKEIQKEILVCEKCSFYTLEKQMFNRHKQRKQSCNIYKEKVNGVEGEHVPENNLDSYILEEKSANQNSVNFFVKNVGQKLADTNKTIYNFKCYDCDLQYMDKNAFEQHVKSHKNSTFRCEHPIFTKHCMKCLYQNVVERTFGKKSLICKYCKYRCNNLESLQNHLKTNVICQGFKVKATKSKIFKCYDCNKELETKLQLWNHSFLHKSHYTCVEHETDKNINGCDKCFYAYIQKNIHPRKQKCLECKDQVLRSELELQGHVEVRHRNSNFTCDLHSDKFVEQCDKCFYQYICFKTSDRPAHVCAACVKFNCKLFSWFDLQEHIKNVHPINLSTVNCSDHINSNQFLNCSKCLFEKILNDRCDLCQCYNCNLQLSSKDKLEVHVRIMHEHSTFQCTKHDLGDINEKCGMCIYESIVVRMKSIV